MDCPLWSQGSYLDLGTHCDRAPGYNGFWKCLQFSDEVLENRSAVWWHEKDFDIWVNIFKLHKNMLSNKQ